jgi:hypothetical protein
MAADHCADSRAKERAPDRAADGPADGAPLRLLVGVLARLMIAKASL